MTTAKTKTPDGLRPFVDYETVDGDGHTVLGGYDWWKPYLPKKYWEWAPQPIREPNQEGNVLCEGRVYKLPMPYPGSQDKSSLGGLMTPGGWKLDDLSSISVEDGRKAGGAGLLPDFAGNDSFFIPPVVIGQDFGFNKAPHLIPEHIVFGRKQPSRHGVLDHASSSIP